VARFDAGSRGSVTLDASVVSCSVVCLKRQVALVLSTCHRLVLDMLRFPGSLRRRCWFTVRNASLSVVLLSVLTYLKKSETTDTFFRRSIWGE